jgi:hypothetical protein
MAWSLSISPEGWQAVEDGLREWDREALITALTDDEFERVEELNGDDGKGYTETVSPDDAANALRERLLPLPHDVLVEAAFEAVQRTHTSDNGGFRIWVDRQGYHGVNLPE